jgi:8-oxo-dGTP diphosphatase
MTRVSGCTGGPGEVSAVRWVTAEEFAGLHPVFAEDLVFFDRVLPQL